MADVPAPVAKLLRAHKIRREDVSLYVHNTTESEPRIAVNAQVPCHRRQS